MNTDHANIRIDVDDQASAKLRQLKADLDRMAALDVRPLLADILAEQDPEERPQ